MSMSVHRAALRRFYNAIRVRRGESAMAAIHMAHRLADKHIAAHALARSLTPEDIAGIERFVTRVRDELDGVLKALEMATHEQSLPADARQLSPSHEAL